MNLDLEMFISELNEDYLGSMEAMVQGLRDNYDPDELSYDIEECETFGELMDLLIEERELVTIWDAPYVALLVLQNPKALHVYLKG